MWISTRSELTLIAKQFDRNHDNEIDIGDFLSLCGPRLQRNESYDRDEVIAVDLVRASLRKLARSEKTGALDIYHLFKELDRKGNAAHFMVELLFQSATSDTFKVESFRS